MKITVTAPDLARLRADLEAVPAEAHDNVRRAVQFTAHGIRDQARGAASGIAHAPSYPLAITYDVDDRGVGGGVSAEIGPEKERRQGALGNLLEYGSVNNAPLTHLGPALDIWTPDLEKGLEKALYDALEG